MNKIIEKLYNEKVILDSWCTSCKRIGKCFKWWGHNNRQNINRR